VKKPIDTGAITKESIKSMTVEQMENLKAELEDKKMAKMSKQERM